MFLELFGQLTSINLEWRDKSTRLALFEPYVQCVLLYGCNWRGVTKLDRRGKIGVNFTGNLIHFIGPV